ncbi:transglycosylase SLT domain-containing protein [Nocardia sp. NBC_00565]|uniref:transglycosylase SLT domain-containing protein n=1 Tax=Nocardia sp. NBC_00565 TaxID=2975993 RepID=UPI002E80EE0F|nr:transglycosylase SLT domain-containing protein [Nocardia sp. NBC_00565]WUC01149.1 transglycosylase SLT domain-containing protein [Nocardia sp. NBC_00565]
MTLTIDDVSNWHPEKLGDAGEHAHTLSTGLDGVIGKGITDTKALEDNKTWSGTAGQAANARMDTEKSRASKVGTELLALETAFTQQVQGLQEAKDRVLRLRSDAINQKPPFEVSPDGTVSAAQRIGAIRKAEGEGRGGSEVAIVSEELEAARRQWELANALRDAEQAANTARTKVSEAVTKLQTVFNDLGDPNLGVTQTSSTSTAPAAVTNSSTSNTSKPNYGSSNHSGSNGSGSPSSSLYSGSTGSSAPTGAKPTGDMAKWIEDAKKALIAMGYDPKDIDENAIALIIQHESAGDPYAENRWDSNWVAGHPSKGLMQTIDSTFNAYKAPGHDDIWNPVDNIIAGVRYSIDTYGSLGNVPGVAAVNSGGAYRGY